MKFRPFGSGHSSPPQTTATASESTPSRPGTSWVDTTLAQMRERVTARNPLPRRVRKELSKLQRDLIDSVWRAEDRLGQGPPPSTGNRRLIIGRVVDARLELIRAIQDIANRDALPMHQAHQVHAHLVRATLVVMNSPCDRPVDAVGARLLYLLVFAGQYYNASVRIGGMSATLIPKLLLSPMEEKTAALTDLHRTFSATVKRVTFKPDTFFRHPTVARHEALHGEQTQAGSESTRRHPSAGRLAAGRRMKYIVSEDIPATGFDLTSATPIEAPAYFVAADVFDLIAPFEGEGRVGRGLAPLHGLPGLVPMLIEAMQALIGSDGESITQTTFEDQVVFCLDDPQVGRLGERLLYDIGTLDQALASSGWSDSATAQLTRLMSDLSQRLVAAPDSGRHKLDLLARALFAFVGGLGPIECHVPLDLSSDEGGRDLLSFEATADASLPLQELLRGLSMTASDGQLDYPRPERLPDALRAEKQSSKFNDVVKNLLDISQHGLPPPQRISDAVMCLAARFVGYDGPGELPAHVAPVVKIVTSTEASFRLYPGLNAPPPGLDEDERPLRVDEGERSTQHPKSHFVTPLFQIEIPGSFFKLGESDKLAPRLAAVAAQLAYVIVAAWGRSDESGNINNGGRLGAGLAGAEVSRAAARALSALGQNVLISQAVPPIPVEFEPVRDPGAGMARAPTSHLAAAHEPAWPTAAEVLAVDLDIDLAAVAAVRVSNGNLRMPAQVKRFIDRNADSPAQALWALVEGTPVLRKEPLWRDSGRATGKAAGDTHAAARSAFEADEARYRQLPWVAWYRAVKWA